MPKIIIEITDEMKEDKEKTGFSWKALIICGLRWTKEQRTDLKRIELIEEKLKYLKL